MELNWQFAQIRPEVWHWLLCSVRWLLVIHPPNSAATTERPHMELLIKRLAHRGYATHTYTHVSAKKCVKRGSRSWAICGDGDAVGSRTSRCQITTLRVCIQRRVLRQLVLFLLETQQMMLILCNQIVRCTAIIIADLINRVLMRKIDTAHTSNLIFRRRRIGQRAAQSIKYKSRSQGHLSR